MLLLDIDLILPIASGTVLLTVLLSFIIYFILLYRKRQEEYEWEKEQAKQLLLKTQIEIKEQTMSNISRELHDNFGQIASLIKINLNMIKAADKDNTSVDESLDLVKQLILDIKSLSTTLKGENLQRFGLLNMIDRDIVRMSKLESIELSRTGDDEIPKLLPETEVFLYRISQEVFNNVLQHSGASEANLKVELSKKIITFKFTDNGKGFDTSTNKKGNGLINLYERCELIKAKLNIESEVGVGTKITININQTNGK